MAVALLPRRNQPGWCMASHTARTELCHMLRQNYLFSNFMNHPIVLCVIEARVNVV